MPSFPKACFIAYVHGPVGLSLFIQFAITEHHKLLAYKEQVFMSHSSGDKEVPHQGAGRSGIWFINSYLLAMTSYGRKDKEALWGLVKGRSY